MRATLDRYEGDYAIIYSDDGRRFKVKKSMVHAKAGSKLLIVLKNNDIVDIKVDHFSTEKTKRLMKEKYFKLHK